MRTLALALLGTALALPSPRISSVRQPGSNARPSQHRDTLANSSSATVPPTTTAPKNNLWNLLTNDEAAEIISYLHNQTTLNLTAATDAGDWDNTVLMVDVLPPNKTNALLYLDGNGTRPERYAYASFLSGATEEPYVQDLVVSPISVSGETTYYSNTFGTSAADAKIRVYNADDNTDSLTDIALSMKDIVPDLLNATIDTAEDFADNFHFWGIGPLWHELDEDGNDRVDYWTEVWRVTDSIFNSEPLLPRGLYLQCDITGRDKSPWTLKGIFCAYEYYTSINDFHAAWQNPTSSSSSQFTMATGPMDFSFYLTFTRDTGMRLYDVKHKGERNNYELGLQEAMAHYAGNDPVQSGTAYTDTQVFFAYLKKLIDACRYDGLGPCAFSRAPGYDTPLYAYCLNTSTHAAEFPSPIDARHASSAYFSVAKNIALTVRSIGTVRNYDYTFDYIFYLDGTIETIARASGYTQSAYYANNTEYGYQIHDSLGSMHDHFITYKVDLDVADTNKTLVKHTIEPKEIKYKWSNQSRSTMHLTISPAQK